MTNNNNNKSMVNPRQKSKNSIGYRVQDYSVDSDDGAEQYEDSNLRFPTTSSRSSSEAGLHDFLMNKSAIRKRAGGTAVIVRASEKRNPRLNHEEQPYERDSLFRSNESHNEINPIESMKKYNTNNKNTNNIIINNNNSGVGMSGRSENNQSHFNLTSASSAQKNPSRNRVVSAIPSNYFISHTLLQAFTQSAQEAFLSQQQQQSQLQLEQEQRIQVDQQEQRSHPSHENEEEKENEHHHHHDGNSHQNLLAYSVSIPAVEVIHHTLASRSDTLSSSSNSNQVNLEFNISMSSNRQNGALKSPSAAATAAATQQESNASATIFSSPSANTNTAYIENIPLPGVGTQATTTSQNVKADSIMLIAKRIPLSSSQQPQNQAGNFKSKLSSNNNYNRTNNNTLTLSAASPDKQQQYQQQQTTNNNNNQTQPNFITSTSQTYSFFPSKPHLNNNQMPFRNVKSNLKNQQQQQQQQLLQTPQQYYPQQLVGLPNHQISSGPQFQRQQPQQQTLSQSLLLQQQQQQLLQQQQQQQSSPNQFAFPIAGILNTKTAITATVTPHKRIRQHGGSQSTIQLAQIKQNFDQAVLFGNGNANGMNSYTANVDFDSSVGQQLHQQLSQHQLRQLNNQLSMKLPQQQLQQQQLAASKNKLVNVLGSNSNSNSSKQIVGASEQLTATADSSPRGKVNIMHTAAAAATQPLMMPSSTLVKSSQGFFRQKDATSSLENFHEHDSSLTQQPGIPLRVSSAAKIQEIHSQQGAKFIAAAASNTLPSAGSFKLIARHKEQQQQQQQQQYQIPQAKQKSQQIVQLQQLSNKQLNRYKLFAEVARSTLTTECMTADQEENQQNLQQLNLRITEGSGTVGSIRMHSRKSNESPLKITSSFKQQPQIRNAPNIVGGWTSKDAQSQQQQFHLHLPTIEATSSDSSDVQSQQQQQQQQQQQLSSGRAASRQQHRRTTYQNGNHSHQHQFHQYHTGQLHHSGERRFSEVSGSMEDMVFSQSQVQYQLHPNAQLQQQQQFMQQQHQQQQQQQYNDEYNPMMELIINNSQPMTMAGINPSNGEIYQKRQLLRVNPYKLKYLELQQKKAAGYSPGLEVQQQQQQQPTSTINSSSSAITMTQSMLPIQNQPNNSIVQLSQSQIIGGFLPPVGSGGATSSSISTAATGSVSAVGVSGGFSGIQYRYCVGYGNNAELIKRLMRNREWWVEHTSNSETVHPASSGFNFRWSQTIQGIKYERLNGVSAGGGMQSANLRQCVNHFEEHREISEKDGLVRNLKLFCETNKLALFSITPATFLIDLNDDACELQVTKFANFFNKHNPNANELTAGAKKTAVAEFKKNISPLFSSPNANYKKLATNIYSKPSMSSTFVDDRYRAYIWLLKAAIFNRGRGIELFSSFAVLEKLIKEYSDGIFDRNLHLAASEDTTNNNNNKDVSTAASSSGLSDANSATPSNAPVTHATKDPIPTTAATTTTAQSSAVAAAGTGVNQSVKSWQILKSQTFVIQKYIERPMLIKGRKFDMRMFVLVTQNIDCYFYKAGYIRTASELYRMDDLDNQFIHLTNNAVQKYAKNYGEHEQGNILSLEQFDEIAKTQHGAAYNLQERVIPMIREVCLMTLASVKKKLNANDRKHCFELFGYDFFIDADYKVWLIEVNSNPSIEESNDYLRQFMPRLVDDALKLTLDVLYPKPGTKQLQQLQPKNQTVNNQATSSTKGQKNTSTSVPLNSLNQENAIMPFGQSSSPKNEKQLLPNELDSEIHEAKGQNATMTMASGQQAFKKEGRKREVYSLEGHPDSENLFQFMTNLTKFNYANYMKEELAKVPASGYHPLRELIASTSQNKSVPIAQKKNKEK